MRITVATKWSELNEWQLEEIATRYLSDKEMTEDDIFQIVRVLFQKSKSVSDELKMRKVFRIVPFSSLVSYAEFLNQMPDLSVFPCLKKYGVRKPGDRLNDISIKQFSVVDAIFNKWITTKSEVYLRQLVASLYTIGKFDVLKLPNVADKTDAVPLPKMYSIAMTYLSVRNYITEQFPKVFPKSKTTDEEKLKPIFRRNTYTPFSKVITAMAMDERQPLGTLHECNNTLIYDFFNTLEESIVRIKN